MQVLSDKDIERAIKELEGFSLWESFCDKDGASWTLDERVELDKPHEASSQIYRSLNGGQNRNSYALVKANGEVELSVTLAVRGPGGILMGRTVQELAKDYTKLKKFLDSKNIPYQIDQSFEENVKLRD